MHRHSWTLSYVHTHVSGRCLSTMPSTGSRLEFFFSSFSVSTFSTDRLNSQAWFARMLFVKGYSDAKD